MSTGRWNIAVGLLVIAAFMAYGFLLVYLRDFAPGKEAWVASYSTGKHFEARLAHAHGNLFALLNIAVGLLLPRLPVSDGQRRVLGWMAITGLLMPTGILAEVYLGAPPLFVLLGGAAMLVTMAWTGLIVARRGLAPAAAVAR